MRRIANNNTTNGAASIRAQQNTVERPSFARLFENPNAREGRRVAFSGPEGVGGGIRGELLNILQILGRSLNIRFNTIQNNQDLNRAQKTEQKNILIEEIRDKLEIVLDLIDAVKTKYYTMMQTVGYANNAELNFTIPENQQFQNMFENGPPIGTGSRGHGALRLKNLKNIQLIKLNKLNQRINTIITTAAEAEAATRIQAVQRGRMGRAAARNRRRNVGRNTTVTNANALRAALEGETRREEAAAVGAAARARRNAAAAEAAAEAEAVGVAANAEANAGVEGLRRRINSTQQSLTNTPSRSPSPAPPPTSSGMFSRWRRSKKNK